MHKCLSQPDDRTTLSEAWASDFPWYHKRKLLRCFPCDSAPTPLIRPPSGVKALVLPCNTEFSVWMWTFKIGQFCLKVFSKTATDRNNLIPPSVRARIEVSDRLILFFKVLCITTQQLIFKEIFMFFSPLNILLNFSVYVSVPCDQVATHKSWSPTSGCQEQSLCVATVTSHFLWSSSCPPQAGDLNWVRRGAAPHYMTSKVGTFDL